MPEPHCGPAPRHKAAGCAAPTATLTSVSGVAALEFAFAAPLLLLLLMGLIEIGYRMFESMQVQSAAEAGALYVSLHGWNSVGIIAAVQNSTDTPGMTASPAPTEFCGCPTTSAPWTIAPIACSSTCAGGAAAGTYAQINAALHHQTIIAYPGLALPMTLTGTAIVRVN